MHVIRDDREPIELDSAPAVERSAIRKVALRLVPFVAIMFVINFLDRTAISFAGPNGLARDLAMTAAQFGLAAGLFFASYILLGVPSNLALHRFGARRWLAAIMVSWGIVSLLFTWVRSLDQLYLLRLLLGATEAGFAPGAIMFLSLWVPARHRARILGLFYISQPLSIVIGAPVASLLIGMDGAFGLAGWRLMFLGVALPAIIIGIVAWFYLADNPAEARWLNPDERDWLTAELATEERAKAEGAGHHGGAVFGNPGVWVLAVIYFGLVYGLYALTFFLPTIIAGFEIQFGVSFDVSQKGLITAIPYVPAAVGLFLWSRFTREGVKAWHIALPAVVGALSIPFALYMSTPGGTVAVITVTASAIFAALPVFWTFPARMLGGTDAAVGIALINTIGNVGGFAAPYITGAMKDATGSYIGSMFAVGGAMLLSAILALSLAPRPGAAK